MTSLNLATIFGPNLLHKQKSSDKEFSVQSSARAEESTAIIAVVQKMIENYEALFMVGGPSLAGYLSKLPTDCLLVAWWNSLTRSTVLVIEFIGIHAVLMGIEIYNLWYHCTVILFFIVVQVRLCAFSPNIPSHIPSGYCQFVLNFHISGSILLSFVLLIMFHL